VKKELDKLSTLEIHQLANLKGQLTQMQATNLVQWGRLMGSEVLKEKFDRAEADFSNQSVKFYFKGPSKSGPRILAKATMQLWVQTLLGSKWNAEVVCGDETGKGKGSPKRAGVRGSGKVPSRSKTRSKRKH